MNQSGRLHHADNGADPEQITFPDEPGRVLADLVVELSAIQSLIRGQDAFRRAFAGKVFATRRIRNRFFPEDLFAEPAWDILLLLYGVEQSQERLSISAVCASVESPATTVLRWIEKLELAGLVHRVKHPRDRRINLLQLSEECTRRLDGFFDSALAIQTAPCARGG